MFYKVVNDSIENSHLSTSYSCGFNPYLLISTTSQASTNKQFSRQTVLKVPAVAWFSAHILEDLHLLEGYTERY